MGKSLRADIIIGGKADGSFYALGDSLLTLGEQVNAISSKLIDFGKESVEAYANYEDAMLDAEVALKTQYNSSSELGRVMEQLDKAALQWANDSRFTTEDVAGAISNAAHAGWDLEKILNGVPAAMNISLAGSMNLAEGLEYLVDITNAAGVPFSDLGELVDYWAYAANRSSTTIPEMGQAMQKMGATMRFVKGDMAGLTTMLAVLANNGAKGTEAGTLLRNSMIRMIAPTRKAAEAMSGLELSSEDLDEVYSNTQALEEASRLLEEAGFSAYDAQGELKSFLEIFQELDRATKGMTEQERNSVLTAIFPTRTITGALALLEAASNGWDGLYDSILGNSSGYAEYAAEKMESGLGGSLRHLESVYNALQTRTGKTLADQVSTGANAISALIEAVNGMDNASFGAIVSGLEVIAAAGPGLMTAGAGIKLVAAIGGTGTVGKIILGATAIGALSAAIISYIDTVNSERFQSTFGENSFDTELLAQYTAGISDLFSQGTAQITQYNEGIQQAMERYEQAAEQFGSDLLTAAITGKTLTPEEIQSLGALGDQMYQAVKEGISGNYSASESIAALMMGEGMQPEEIISGDWGVWSGIMEVLNAGFSAAEEQAAQLGQRLREAMTSAFADGGLTGEEYSGILAVMQEYNDLIAIQATAKNQAQTKRALDKMQTMGLTALEEGAQMIAQSRESDLAAEADRFYQLYETYSTAAEMMLRNGTEITDEVTGESRLFTQADRDRQLQALEASYQERVKSIQEGYLQSTLQLFDTGARGSDFGSIWEQVSNEAETWLTTGENRTDGDTFYSREMDKFFGMLFDAAGGRSVLETAAEGGDLEAARMLAMQSAMAGRGTFSEEGISPDYVNENARAAEAAQAQQRQWEIDLYDRSSTLDALYGEESRLIAEAEQRRARYENGDYSALDYLLQRPQEDQALLGMGDTLFGETLAGKLEAVQGKIGEELGQLAQMTAQSAAAAQIQPRQGGMGLEDLEGQGVAVQVTGDTAMLAATIAAEDGNTLLEYVDADTGQLHAAIYAEDGRTLLEYVNGDTSALEAAIAALNGRTITVSVAYNQMAAYAEGGRADQASIFGEAGPEWAIPEEHSQRTAQLLDMARQASGFTWPELLSRNGGLNAMGSGSYTLLYSPTIIANDANGVENKLMEDKKRLERWLREKELHESLEVYA